MIEASAEAITDSAAVTANDGAAVTA